jgi:ribonucleotide monophosphatase NagD (HAD superfamily)
LEIAEGLKGLADRFDVMLIDQWGVIHDGGDAPYPGAVECMRELQRLGKHIVLLSNSSKRKAGSLV